MKRFMSLILLASVTTVLGCTAVAQGPSDAEMVSKAEELGQRFVAAFNAGDVDAIADCYWNSPDVVTLPPDMLEARGHEAVRAGFEDMVRTMPGVHLEMTETHEIPAGDKVIGWGLIRLTMPGPDGQEVEMVGRYTDVKAERDGKWVYLIDHASMPLPAPEEPAAGS